jgi:hypothetical protein
LPLEPLLPAFFGDGVKNPLTKVPWVGEFLEGIRLGIKNNAMDSPHVKIPDQPAYWVKFFESHIIYRHSMYGQSIFAQV